jgi:hypothetical protein
MDSPFLSARREAPLDRSRSYSQDAAALHGMRRAGCKARANNVAKVLTLVFAMFLRSKPMAVPRIGG